MGNSTNITYGDYNFQSLGGPVPFLNITKETLVSDDGKSLGTIFNMLVEGTLTPAPTGLFGYVNIDAMQDSLLTGFGQDGLEFKVTCGASTLMSVYPRIRNISLPRSPDNWTQTSPYTIDLTWEESGISGDIFVNSASESWDIQIDDTASPYNWSTGAIEDSASTFANVSHSLSAQGIAHYDASVLVKPAWQQARDWVTGQLGLDNSVLGSPSVLNLNSSAFVGYNHIRVQSYDEKAGSFSVQESWTAVDSGAGLGYCGNAREDFTANIQYDLGSDLTTVTINGTIQGLETVNYGEIAGDYSLTTNKYSAASGYWDCVQTKLFTRANLVGSGIATRVLNPARLNFSVGHNPTAGLISYTYTYDDRPCNFVSGSLSESIAITDVNPTDVFASLTALGRAFGPILQDIDTVTASIKAVNIDVLMPIPTGCLNIINNIDAAPNVDTLLCEIERSVSGSNITYFKSQDQKSWNPKTGRFTQSVEWTYTPCDGTPPSTTFLESC